MDILLDSLVMIGMFFLRLGVPLLIVIGVGYLLRRLDARWEAEAWQQAAEAQKAERQSQRQPLPIQPPLPLPGTAPQPAMLTATTVFGQPCWDIKNCPPEQRQQCAAFQQPDASCWSARLQAEGKLPVMCYNCSIYAATQPPLPLPQAELPQIEIRH